MSNKLSIGLSLVLALNSSMSFATPIDGWTEQAYKENQGLLKSVIKIGSGEFYAQSTCSATLIAKNILLTAKHCVNRLSPGKQFTLNEDAAYQVISVLQQPKIAVTKGLVMGTHGMVASSTSTDMALVLFASLNCGSSSLAGVKPIALAIGAVKADLSNKVLIAGYGLTSPNANDSGTLHAGYNEWLVSDYSKGGDAKLTEYVRSQARESETPDDVLTMVGQRSEASGFVNIKGSKIANELMSLLDNTKPATESLPLPGDSGGPAIASDSKGNPYVVGVTSMAAPRILEAPKSLIVMDLDTGKILLQLDYPRESTAEQQSDLRLDFMDLAVAKLRELKYIDVKNTVLKSFIVGSRGGRMGLGTYGSTLNPANAPFLSQGIAQLSKQRDAGNYCQ